MCVAQEEDAAELARIRAVDSTDNTQCHSTSPHPVHLTSVYSLLTLCTVCVSQVESCIEDAATTQRMRTGSFTGSRAPSAKRLATMPATSDVASSDAV